MVSKPHRRSNRDLRDKSKSPGTSKERTNGQSSAEPTRHTEFWLHDGSIVLCVEETLFRVHQTILANHSEVFADLFRLPQPTTTEGEEGQGKDGDEMQKVDGCYVVHLQDNTDDFVDLLKAIYYPSHFDNLSPTADLDTILSFISGILRLSTKYFIRELRKRCIAILTTKFPTTYQECTAKMSKSSSSRSHPKIVYRLASTPDPPSAPSSLPPPIPVSSAASSTLASTSTSPTLVPPSPTPPMPSTSKDHSKHKISSIMRAINLAQQTNVPLILPFAFYEIARNLPRRLLSHSSSSISWHQKTICLVGREQLRIAEMSLSHSFLLAFQPSPRCRSPSFCGNARGPHAEWHVLESTGHGPNPLKAYDKWEKMNVCVECVKDSRRAHERGKEEVWERLPQFFELGDWAELRTTQDR